MFSDYTKTASFSEKRENKGLSFTIPMSKVPILKLYFRIFQASISSFWIIIGRDFFWFFFSRVSPSTWNLTQSMAFFRPTNLNTCSCRLIICSVLSLRRFFFCSANCRHTPSSLSKNGFISSPERFIFFSYQQRRPHSTPTLFPSPDLTHTLPLLPSFHNEVYFRRSTLSPPSRTRLQSPTLTHAHCFQPILSEH